MLNFTKIKLLAEGEVEATIDITQAFIHSIQDYKREYRNSIINNDKIKFSYITHKIKGELRFLEIYCLVDEINAYRSALYNDKVTDEMTRENLFSVDKLCDKVVERLENEISEIRQNKTVNM